MINSIESSYIIKKIFSYINGGLKLKICKLNKKIQSKININLLNYKIFSGRYITHESNGKVKEYNRYNDKLVFEGEYLNGQRNGKGKEYNFDGTILFEGEYKNGKRNGKGKENYDNETLKFEGEYFNGKKWNGKGYKNDIAIYELEEGNGYVKEYNDDFILIFEGENKNGERNGRG